MCKPAQRTVGSDWQTTVLKTATKSIYSEKVLFLYSLTS